MYLARFALKNPLIYSIQLKYLVNLGSCVSKS